MFVRMTRTRHLRRTLRSWRWTVAGLPWPAPGATCHVPPLFTEPGYNLHEPSDIGIDDFQASRSPDGKYRTTPLRGLFARMKGGFYHDGRFPDLGAVIDHYNGHFKLNLTANEKRDLSST